METRSYKKPVLKIGLFFDGTGNDERDPEEHTNIYKLYERYKVSGDSYRGYIRGVGSKKDSKKNGSLLRSMILPALASGEVASDWINEKLGAGFGKGGGDKISQGVEHIEKALDIYHQNYNSFPGDVDFNIFGFSRGASLARHFVNVIHKKKFEIGEKYKSDKINFKTNFLGIYDSVGSFGLPDDDDGNYELNITEDMVNNAYHIIAQDEKRENFSLQSLIDDPDPQNKKNFVGFKTIKKLANGLKRVIRSGRLKEEIGLGVHSDVGGSYRKNSISNYYFRKMYYEAFNKNVPLNPIEEKKSATDKEAEILIENIQNIYEKFPDLREIHMELNAIEDYVIYIRQDILHEEKENLFKAMRRKLLTKEGDEKKELEEYYKNNWTEMWEWNQLMDSIQKYRSEIIEYIGAKEAKSFFEQYEKLREKYMHFSSKRLVLLDKNTWGMRAGKNEFNKEELRRKFYLNKKHIPNSKIKVVRTKSMIEDYKKVSKFRNESSVQELIENRELYEFMRKDMLENNEKNTSLDYIPEDIQLIESKFNKLFMEKNRLFQILGNHKKSSYHKQEINYFVDFEDKRLGL